LVFPEYNKLSVTRCVSELTIIDILESGVEVSVGDGVFVSVDASVAVTIGVGIVVGAQEANKMIAGMMSNDVLIFIFTFILQGTAQRFALPACGRAWIRFGSRKNSKREKCSKMPQNPTRQVHALLAGVFYISRWFQK
jgi:hypothetical protein